MLDVLDHPGARGPSFLLRLDLGPRGEREAQMEPGTYNRDELLGELVVVSLGEGPIVLLAHSHANGPVLVQPTHHVEPGTVVA